MKLPGDGSSRDDEDDGIIDFDDLDQKPRVVHQPEPVLTAALRKKTPGTVKVIFLVDERGRVEKPLVVASTDSAFEAPTLAAVRQWRFEPGKSRGKPVKFRMRIPISFPKSG